MNKFDFMLECFGPDLSPYPFGFYPPLRRRRWSPMRVAFHRDPAGQDHEHNYHGGVGPARYAGTKRKVFTLGVAGPVGAGKTILVEALCRALWPELNLAVITNDIYTHEDAEYLTRREVLPFERIVGVQTGGCPHTAIRDDASANLSAVANLERQFPSLELVIVESGGDNLTAVFSRELADRFIFIIDVAEGDKIPRKGGPGICNSDLLVINKIDLAPHVGADLEVMKRNSLKMRGERPFLMVSFRQKDGVEDVKRFLKDLAMTAEVDDSLPLKRRRHALVRMVKANATGRKADRRRFGQERLKPLGLRRVVHQDDSLFHVALSNMLDQFIGELPDKRLGVRRVHENAAAPRLRQPAILGCVVPRGLHDLVGLIARCRVEIDRPHNGRRPCDVFRRRIPFIVAGIVGDVRLPQLRVFGVDGRLT